jgi:uncharacterized protein YbaP (TraB family)
MMFVRSVAILIGLTIGCGGAGTSSSTKQRTPKTHTALHRDSSSGPLLWKVEKGGKVSHVLALPPEGVDLDELPPVVWRVLDRSKAVAVKRDPAASSPENKTSPERPLIEALGKDDFAKLIAALANLNIDKDKLKKGPAMLAIAVLLYHWLFGVSDPEGAFAKRVAERHLSMTILDPDFYTDPKLQQAYGVKRLRLALMNADTMRVEIEANIKNYRKGNAAALAATANRSHEDSDDPEALLRWYREIGTEWLDRLEPLLKRGKAFVALDYDEVLHQRGLLAGLAKRGYRLTRLAGAPPTIAARARPRVWPSECVALIRPLTTRMLRAQFPKQFEGPKGEELLEKAVARGRAGLTNLCLHWTRPILTCYQQGRDAKSLAKCEAMAKKRAKASGSPSPRQSDRGMKGAIDIELLAERACTCRDADCARGVLTEFETYLMNHRDQPVSKSVSKRAGKAAKKMTKCMIGKGVDRKEILDAMQRIQGS